MPEQQNQKHENQSNISHVMLTASWNPAPELLASTDGKNDNTGVINFLGQSMPILLGSYQVGTTTKAQVSTSFPRNAGALDPKKPLGMTSADPAQNRVLQNHSYNKSAGSSLDSIFVPIMARFKSSNLGGDDLTEQDGMDSTNDFHFPSFEVPYGFTDSQGNAKTFSDAIVAGSGLPNSAVLNPFVVGSTTKTLLSGTSPEQLRDGPSKRAEKSLPQFGSTEIRGESPARPLAFKGPMVMSGWGFDLEGLPVPNARFDSAVKVHDPESKRFGQPVMFKELFFGSAISNCTPQGIGYVESSWSSKVNNQYTDTDGSEVYVLSDGSSVIFSVQDKGTDSEACVVEQTFPNSVPHATRNHFLQSHLKRTDKWKTGPIDLRWDRERKVWVGGRHNGVYLSKATKCIMPKAGPDGKNSFNLGVGGNISNPGRLYRNVCPNEPCEFSVYFARSPHYPDIEIYDPEDIDWGGNCQVKEDGNGNPYVNCTDFRNNCVPFYDAVILRSVDHFVAGGDYSDCGDKFRKTSSGSPYSRRMGDPCHGMGGAYSDQQLNSKVEHLGNKIDAGRFSETAMTTLYQKIFIENPLGQGLNLGDNFFSYDTGRRVIFEYVKSDMAGSHLRNGFPAGNPVTVKEIIPVHVILQGEFFGMDIITHAGCEQGEMTACTRKFFAQGYVTPEDCGPDDDYPTRGII